MLDLVGDERTKVLAYIIKRKDPMNVIHASMREIAEGADVSEKTVGRVFRTLKSRDFIHKVSNGKWRLSPRVMVNGDTKRGLAVINYYDNVDKQ